MQSVNDINTEMKQGTILHVTPTEAAGFVEWALVNGVFDDAMKRVLQAYAESRRGTFASIKYWLSTHCNEMRAMEHACTPDENKRREICGHKADKLDNVIFQIDSMEQGTEGFKC